MIKDGFTLSTLLVLGGLAQTILSMVLPSHYALLPLLFLLLRAIVVTVLNSSSPGKYVADFGLIPGRTSAQLPKPSFDPLKPSSASPFGSVPAEESIVVFHLGARVTHPLGLLAPGGKEFGDQFIACNKELLKRAKEFGCLGGTTWRGNEADSNNTILNIYYFRDMEGLNRFAHDPVHRQAWDWYNKDFVKKMGFSHIGIFHEAFYAPSGNYETIYINMPPVLMGAGSAKVRNEASGEDEWVRTLVDAEGPVWRTQYSRMGRQVKKQEERN